MTSRRKRAFDSVFPSAKIKDLAPTPAITPQLGSTSPGRPFGGVSSTATASFRDTSHNEPYPEQVIWDRAWHTATAALSLPEEVIDLSGQALTDLCKARYSNLNGEILEAFRYVLSPSSAGRLSRQGKAESDLLEWYVNAVRQHFLTYVKPAVVDVSVSNLLIVLRLIDAGNQQQGGISRDP